MMQKTNGVLAAALRVEINRRDLLIKEVATMIRRSEPVVFKILRGEKVSPRTMAQVEKAFPDVFV